MLDIAFEAPKPKVIAGARSDWELVIGLEVHAQIASKAKLFSDCGDSGWGDSGRKRFFHLG